MGFHEKTKKGYGKRYSIDDIHYKLDIARDCLSDRFQEYVYKALGLLNNKIIDKISDKILFISSDIVGAVYIPLNSDYTRGQKSNNIFIRVYLGK